MVCVYSAFLLLLLSTNESEKQNRRIKSAGSFVFLFSADFVTVSVGRCNHRGIVRKAPEAQGHRFMSKIEPLQQCSYVPPTPVGTNGFLLMKICHRFSVVFLLFCS